MSGPGRPRCLLGRLHRKQIDVEAEKREGWCDHRILVVSADDHRLTWPERELVKQLGGKLYGKGGGRNDG